jgi:hypothetical protein
LCILQRDARMPLSHNPLLRWTSLSAQDLHDKTAACSARNSSGFLFPAVHGEVCPQRPSATATPGTVGGTDLAVLPPATRQSPPVGAWAYLNPLRSRNFPATATGSPNHRSNRPTRQTAKPAGFSHRWPANPSTTADCRAPACHSPTPSRSREREHTPRNHLSHSRGY